MARRLAVALHDVEPATYERCALIRDWLSDLGVDRVTLLVTPAPAGRSPGLAEWLAERRAAGDAVVDGPAVRPPARGPRRAELLRLDIRPADLERRRRVAAVEALLLRSRSRVAVTCDAQ